MNMNRRDMIKGAFGATAATLVPAVAIPEEIRISPEDKKRDVLFYLANLQEEDRSQMMHLMLSLSPEATFHEFMFDAFDDGCSVSEVYELMYG